MIGFGRVGFALDILKGSVTPYIAGNITWVLMLDDHATGFGYGGGVKLKLSRSLACRIDLQFLKATFDTDIAERFIDGGGHFREFIWPFKDKFAVAELTIGLSVYLGRR